MTGGPYPQPRSLSFVVPAYNEAPRLGASLERLIDFGGQQPYAVEIILVDDGSSDSTAEIALEAAQRVSGGVSVRLLQHERNRGKGAAVRTGALAATGDVVLYLDADLATPPEEARRLLEALAAGADVAAGSRVQPGGLDMRASQPAWRRIGGRLFALARRLGFSVRQVPVEWRHIEGSQFKLSPVSALREVGDLLRIRWLHRRLEADESGATLED